MDGARLVLSTKDLVQQAIQAQRTGPLESDELGDTDELLVALVELVPRCEILRELVSAWEEPTSFDPP